MALPSSNTFTTGDPDPQFITAFSRGLLAQTFPSQAVATELTISTQKIFGSIIPLTAGMVITNIVVCTTTAAAGAQPTAVFLGLYDLAGNKLAATADVKATFAAAQGLANNALSATYTVTTTGSYYVVLLKNGTYAGTDPKVLCAVAKPAGSGGALGSNAPDTVSQTGQTTLGTTQTLTADVQAVWFGVS